MELQNLVQKMESTGKRGMLQNLLNDPLLAEIDKEIIKVGLIIIVT